MALRRSDGALPARKLRTEPGAPPTRDARPEPDGALPQRSPLPGPGDKRAAVRAMFDRIAPRYDALNRLMTAGLDRRWRRRALDAVRVGAGDRVLDLACGTGDLAQLAIARGARCVIGVDLAGGMLRGAHRRGIRGLVQGDAACLPLRDASVDVVCSGFALRNFDSLDAVVREVARVLAPRGRMVLLDVDRPHHALLGRAHGFYFDRVVPILGGLLSDRDAYRYLPASTVYLPARPQLAALLESAGLEEVRGERWMAGAVQVWTARRPEAVR